MKQTAHLAALAPSGRLPAANTRSQHSRLTSWSWAPRWHIAVLDLQPHGDANPIRPSLVPARSSTRSHTDGH